MLLSISMPTTEYEPGRPSYQELLAAYDRARETWERNPGPHSLAVLETGLQFLVQELQRPGKFEMGQMVMTPGADEALRAARQVPLAFLLRHKNGDWGELPEEDIRENAWPLENGARLFSAASSNSPIQANHRDFVVSIDKNLPKLR
jgi:hypothetical protein